MSLIGKSLNDASQILSYGDMYAWGGRFSYGNGNKTPFYWGSTKNNSGVIPVDMTPQEFFNAIGDAGYNEAFCVGNVNYSTIHVATTQNTPKKYDRSRIVLSCGSWKGYPAPVKADNKLKRLIDLSYDISESGADNVEATAGITADNNNGQLNAARILSCKLILNRTTGSFVSSETYLGNVSRGDSSYLFHIQNASVHNFEVRGSTAASGKRPGLGSGSYKWDTVYAVNGTIETSDERQKEQIEDIPNAWLDAIDSINFKRFKMKDAVNLKGSDARWHVGVIAQDVNETFSKHGIDAVEIGLCCYDSWDEEHDKDTGELIHPAGDLWGVRYTELLSLKSAAQDRQISNLQKLLSSQ